MELKVKLLKITAGGRNIVILDDDTAGLLGVYSSDRVTISHKDRTSIAIANIGERFYHGCIGLYEEVAKRMNVKSSSVNSALKTLSEKGLVVHEKYGYVALTKEGEKVALEIQNKHDILFRLLTEFLMLDEKVAAKDACAIEHTISKQTFLRLIKFFQFLEHGLNGARPKLLRNFEIYLKTGRK